MKKRFGAFDLLFLISLLRLAPLKGPFEERVYVWGPEPQVELAGRE